MTCERIRISVVPDHVPKLPMTSTTNFTFWSASLPFGLQVCLSQDQPCLQEYVAAVAQDQTAAAEKAAMLMSATGGSPAGVGSEYVIDPPSTLAAEDSDDNSDGENDDVAPLDRQVYSNWSTSHSTPVMPKAMLKTAEYSCKRGLGK